MPKELTGKSYERMSFKTLEAKEREARTKGTPGALKRADKMREILDFKDAVYWDARSRQPKKGTAEAKEKMAIVRSYKKPGQQKRTGGEKLAHMHGKSKLEDIKIAEELVETAQKRGRGHPHYFHHAGGGNKTNAQMYGELLAVKRASNARKRADKKRMYG